MKWITREKVKVDR